MPELTCSGNTLLKMQSLDISYILQETIKNNNMQQLTLTDLTTARDLVNKKLTDFMCTRPLALSKGGNDVVLTDEDKVYIEALEARKKRIVDAIDLILETL